MKKLRIDKMLSANIKILMKQFTKRKATENLVFNTVNISMNTGGLVIT